MSASANRVARVITSRTVRAVVAIVAVLVVIAGIGLRARSQADRRRQAAFLQRFEASFTSGTMQLLDPASIEEIDRFIMSEFAPTIMFRPPEVDEYVVTARFQRGQEVRWGRWLYTCNQNHGDFVYKFSYSEAASEAALPEFPFPLQTYLPGRPSDPHLIDGTPSSAGPTATIVAVNSPLAADELLIVRAIAPVGTTCSIVCYQPDALLSDPGELQPAADGSLVWNCEVNPKMAGGGFSLLVQCTQPRGTARFENLVQAPSVTVLPPKGQVPGTDSSE